MMYASLLAESFKGDPLVLEQAGANARDGLHKQFRTMMDAVYLERGHVDIALADENIAGVTLRLRLSEYHSPVPSHLKIPLRQAAESRRHPSGVRQSANYECHTKPRAGDAGNANSSVATKPAPPTF